jgi:peptidyl-prolyl cis-trans isomerase SurA
MPAAFRFPLFRYRTGTGLLVLLLGAAPVAGHAAAAQPAANAKPAAPALQDATRIAAVVNGDVISNLDINNRARLFALSTGLPLAPDVIQRLKPQILRQLIDERLRVQEAQRRKIVIQDKQIAESIHEIEQHNGMQAGLLRQKLAADGVSQRTLIDQIRGQLAWTEVLRQQMAEKVSITDAEVAEQQKLESQRVGQQEFRLGEIFIPVDNPSNAADAQRFAETVISELHAGAAFPMVAAQFSQTQTALEGGEVGWVQANQLDPEVARLVTQMPIGAISNPVKVPGGFSIIALQGRREIGREIGTVATIRQAFLSFTTPLDPQAPTDQQRQALAKAREISATVHGCEQMDQVAKVNNGPGHAADPGEIRVDGVNPPAFRSLLMTLPLGKTTEPLVSRDGIAVITICSREEKNTATATPQDIQRRLVNERVELLSRQTMRDLHRQANIDLRGGGV